MRVPLIAAPWIAAFVALGAASAAADVLERPIPSPAWTKTVGVMRVQKYGAGAPALILVPGLGCGAWVWRDTIAREAKSHVVYAVTLAGFDGVPAVPSAGLDAADASIATLIASEKLDRPVLIGHSLGGFLALRFGTERPNLLRGVVAVDGLPVLPPFADATPEQRADAGAKFTAAVAQQSAVDFKAAEQRIVRDYVTDATLTRRVLDLMDRSDQQAIGTYGGQLYAADIRALLPKLSVATIVIAPVPGKPLPSYLPAAMSQMTLDQMRTGTVEFYASLVKGAPQATVVPVDDARHFVMLDQPDAFSKALDSFLQTLK